MIDVQSLTYDYPGLRALDAVNFRIEEASITALVGPNGAGKSTLLRCISALDDPHEGRILIDGRDVHEDPRASHAIVGYLPDTFGLYGGLTVMQCLRHRAGTHGIKGAAQAEAARRVAATLGLEDKLVAQAEELSRGQRQRVAIAEAIIHQPKVLLLDEPASGLDPEARAELSTVLRKLAAGGVTILVSSHILAELEDYSTHLLALERGRVVAHRPIHDVGASEAATLQVALAATDARLAAVLAAADVETIEVSDRSARIRLAADPAGHALLLKHLLEAGLPVSHFATEQADLQRLYLEALRATRGASA